MVFINILLGALNTSKHNLRLYLNLLFIKQKDIDQLKGIRKSLKKDIRHLLDEKRDEVFLYLFNIVFRTIFSIRSCKPRRYGKIF